MDFLSNKGILKLVDNFVFFTSAKGIIIVSITVLESKTINFQ